MDMTGERRIAAPRQIVWEALNNPEVLKSSIPGCTDLQKTDDTHMKATAAVKIGPISARFTGNVELTDLDPPNGYSIGGEGQGGVAGFAKGGAKVKLLDDGAATVLSYDVHAQVGGKIAQLGARLIDATAKQMADAFFTKFSAQVEAQVAAANPVEAPAEAPVTMASTEAAAVHAAPVDVAPAGAPVDVQPARAPVMPPSQISLFALVPREPFGLPLAAWIGGGVFVVMLLLMFGSMLK